MQVLSLLTLVSMIGKLVDNNLEILPREDRGSEAYRLSLVRQAEALRTIYGLRASVCIPGAHTYVRAK